MSRVDEATEAAARMFAVMAGEDDRALPAAWPKRYAAVIKADMRHGALKVLGMYHRTLYGCKECGGTGKQLVGADGKGRTQGYDPGSKPIEVPCPAEHVPLTILGVEIQADPETCWYVCKAAWYIGKSSAICEAAERSRGPWGEEVHKRLGCGWVPRLVTELEAP